MRGVLIVADAATTHDDGTFSLLRGGITRISAPNTKPLVLRAAVLLRLSYRRGEAGKHTFVLKFMDQDGQSLLPEYTQTFDATKNGGHVQLSLSMSIPLPKPGEYEFSVSVDGVLQDSWPITAVHT